MRRASASLGIVVALASACASGTSGDAAVPSVSAAPGRAPIQELVKRKVGPERASLTATPIDYASIPTLGPSAKCLWDDAMPPVPDPCAPFYVERTTTAPKCAPDERPNPRPAWKVGDTISETTIQRAGHVDGGPAEWIAVTRPSGTDALFVARYEGAAPGDRALASGRRKVAAKAVVPHQLYVFRACEAACDAPLSDPGRVERVTLLGPPSVWVGSSGDPRDAELSGDRPFTMISSTIRPGESASLTIAYTSAAGSRFQGAEDTSSVATNVQTVTLELLWDGPSPALTVYRGTIPAGAASDVAEPQAPRPDCEPQGRR